MSTIIRTEGAVHRSRDSRSLSWVVSRPTDPRVKAHSPSGVRESHGVWHIQDVSNGPIGEEDKLLFYHAALVIQAKTQYFLNACRYHLEFLASEIKKMPSTVYQAWKYPEINQRSQRLLELCLIFKAKQEGLKLLESMGNEMIPNSPTSQNNIPNMFVEGIRDDLVAKAVADFVTQISGNYLHF